MHGSLIITIENNQHDERPEERTSAKKSPVAPPKVLTRKPSPKQKLSPVFSKRPVTSSSPVLPVDLPPRNQTFEEAVYETPSITTSNNNNTMANSTIDYETPISIVTEDTYETPISSSIGNTSAGETYEVPISVTNDTTTNNNEVYEVPISTANDTHNSSTYETPDIASIRMIQQQLTAGSKTDKPLVPHSAGIKNTSTADGPAHSPNDDDIPPPPAMVPPKPKQSSISKRKDKRLPPVPPLSNKTQGDNSKANAKGKVVVFNSRKISKDGLIYEEIQPKNNPVLEDDEYIDLSNLLPEAPGDPGAPPLPPRKNHIPGSSNETNKSGINHITQPRVPLVKTHSPLGEGGGIELTEEEEDYVDMSSTIHEPSSVKKTDNNRIRKNRVISDTSLIQHISTEYTPEKSKTILEYEASDGVYEQMDISRPVPPPRRRNKQLKQLMISRELKTSLSFDSVMTNGNYVTMHAKR